MSAAQKVAIITGITGQDGAYLAELLLSKDYTVHGLIRRSSSFNTRRVDHLYKNKNFRLHYSDLTDASSLNHLIASIRPTEVYNLGAQSHVKVSFETPEYTAQVDGVGTLRLLEAVRSSGLEKTCRVYQASTSEMFGLVQEVPQKETTPFYPRSPYAVAKVYAYWICVNYRESYDMFVCNGILFNHESPRRGATFVTRKITRAVARIKQGKQSQLRLGNVHSLRDWGHARDYVEGMWRILQQEKPEDWVLATGEQHSVKEFCDVAFARVGYQLEWTGEGVDEYAFDKADPAKTPLIVVDPEYFRPAEVETLLGDASKAKKKLGWTPTCTFTELVHEMVDSDMDALTNKTDDWS